MTKDEHADLLRKSGEENSVLRPCLGIIWQNTGHSPPRHDLTEKLSLLPPSPLCGFRVFLLEPQLSGVSELQHHLQTQPENRLYCASSARKRRGWSKLSQEGCKLGGRPPASPCSRGLRAGETAPGALGTRAGGSELGAPPRQLLGHSQGRAARSARK